MKGAPHFLRFTRALALVSGIGLPALGAACGGQVDSLGDPTADRQPYDGADGGIQQDPDPGAGGGVKAPPDAEAYDGRPMGAVACEDGGCGVQGPPEDASVYDGAPVGVVPLNDAGVYDGMVMGVVPYRDAATDVGIGGPLNPPELPA